MCATLTFNGEYGAFFSVVCRAGDMQTNVQDISTDAYDDGWDQASIGFLSPSGLQQKQCRGSTGAWPGLPAQRRGRHGSGGDGPAAAAHGGLPRTNQG
jgi:hypothetical protein